MDDLNKPYSSHLPPKKIFLLRKEIDIFFKDLVFLQYSGKVSLCSFILQKEKKICNEGKIPYFMGQSNSFFSSSYKGF